MDRGYITEAVYASLFMLSLYPGHKILETTQRLLHENRVSTHAQFLAIAGAIRDRDHQRQKTYWTNTKPTPTFPRSPGSWKAW